MNKHRLIAEILSSAIAAALSLIPMLGAFIQRWLDERDFLSANYFLNLFASKKNILLLNN